MKKVILATHGYLAQGIKSALEIITSDVSNIIAVNGFTDDCPDPESEIKRILEEHPDDNDLLVLTDINFGSVNQIFMRELQKRDLKVVTGINLPLAVELLSSLDNGLSDTELQTAIELSRQELRLVKMNLQQNSSVEDADEAL